MCAQCKRRFSTLEQTALAEDGHLASNDELRRLREATRVLAVAIESVAGLLKN
jgi:hypothetical protein